MSDSLEVLVFGLLGPGSRGRPCVTRDVTKVMQQESLKMLAAFVGILDDQAVQENLPGEALHGLEGNLMFPLLQVCCSHLLLHRLGERVVTVCTDEDSTNHAIAC